MRQPLTSKVANLTAQLRHRADRVWVRNRASRNMFEQNRPVLDDVQRRVLRDLRARGLAVAHFSDLFGDDPRWSALATLAAQFTASPQARDAQEAWRAGERRVAKKSYLVRLVADGAAIPVDDPWLRLGVDARLLDIANSYLGLMSRVIYSNVWYTLADDRPRAYEGSQRWHRDPEDSRVLKVFLYLSDVDETAGPLEYVIGSQPRESAYLGTGWPPALASAPGDDIPGEHVLCTGGRGTIVFCETTGFHRGGFATTRERVLATWAYVTPASRYPRRYSVIPPTDPCLPLAAQLAIA